MKSVVFIPLALLIGLMVGAWPLRSQLRQSRERIEELEDLLRDRKPSRGSTPLNALSPIIRLPEASSETNETPTAITSADDAASTNRDEMAAASTNRNRRARHSLSNELARAAAMWRIRADVAREVTIGEMKLNHKQAAKFDVILAGMNIRLRDRFAFWADEIQQSEEMTEELGVRMMSDLGSVMVQTYEEFDSNLPEGWRDRTEEDLRLTDFIDPSVAEPLIGVEGKLDRHRQRNEERSSP